MLLHDEGSEPVKALPARDKYVKEATLFHEVGSEPRIIFPSRRTCFMLDILLQDTGSVPVRELLVRMMVLRAGKEVIASGSEPVRQVRAVRVIMVTDPLDEQLTPVQLQADGLMVAFQLAKAEQFEAVLDKAEAMVKRAEVSGLGGGGGEGGGELEADACER